MLLVAAVLRLLAAIFSQGFLASDDHHVVIAAADRIASGAGLPTAYARSAVLPGAIAGIMIVGRFLGIQDPGSQLLLVRLIQAAYSLLVVYFVYRILEQTLGPDSAQLGGLLAAVFYVMPVTSVHQLEESVCQVPLLAAYWWWIRSETAISRLPSAGWGALAGIAAGLALILRFPLIGFLAAFVALVLIRPAPTRLQGKLALLGGLALVIVLQGYSNALINHEWWFSFTHRLGAMLHPRRMALDAGDYPSAPPWHYLLTLLAALIPPASVLLLAAAVKGASRRAFRLLGIATLTFLVSHSIIANKQERFLLPVLPMLFVLIVAGLPWLAARIARAYRGMWWYFWIVNAALLVVLMFSSSKKDRVAPLLYIYRRHDATGVLVAQYNETFQVPAYYLGKPQPELIVVQHRDEVQTTGVPINYVVLYSDSLEADRVFLAEALRRPLTLLTVITPSLTDRLAHAINPKHNKARTAAVYTIS